jgi:hypothetical protein
MTAGAVFAIVAVVVVVAAVLAFWMHTRAQHPEDTASHDTRYTVDREDAERMAPYPGTDRPGGPGAEGMAVPQPGDVGTGPEPPNDVSGLAPDPNLDHGTGAGQRSSERGSRNRR